MELHKTSAAVLLAALTREELSAYRLSFDELAADSAQTARVVREILLCARRTLDFSVPARGRLRIDVLPEPGGGCIFLFTARKTRLRVLHTGRSLLFCTQDADAFLDLLKLLSRPPLCRAKQTLYRTSTGFAALFSFDGAQSAERGARLLSEYGTVCPARGRVAQHLAEHARAIEFTSAPQSPAS